MSITRLVVYTPKATITYDIGVGGVTKIKEDTPNSYNIYIYIYIYIYYDKTIVTLSGNFGFIAYRKEIEWTQRNL